MKLLRMKTRLIYRCSRAVGCDDTARFLDVSSEDEGDRARVTADYYVRPAPWGLNID